MKQKIELYREVLDLEPGSRVFFPLAKLLVADSQIPEAILVLQQGLTRHPNNMEARLFLVEQLYIHDAHAACNTEIEGLSSIFVEYAGFWDAWSAHLAQKPGMQDAALALRFFAAALKGTPVSFASVLEEGLQAVIQKSFLQPQASAPKFPCPLKNSTPGKAQSSANTALCNVIDSMGEKTSETVPHSSVADNSTPSLAINDNLRIVQAEFAPHVNESISEADLDDDAGEVFTLRTRSMAEVLAEQGDIAGALDIYQELLTNAPADAQQNLQVRINELTTRTHTSHLADLVDEQEAPAPTGTESARLVSLLESLAQRLEARAR